MQRSKADIWVGLFVLAGAVALLFLALQAGNLLSVAPRQGYQIRAVFQDIGGLKPKAAVKSSGVVVGRVKAIEFDNEKFQAVAVLDMDGKYRFPKDSMLKIMTSGLLGDQYVGVEAGYDEATWQPDEKVTNTQSAIVLENLIGQFMNSKALEAGDSRSGSSASAEAGGEPATETSASDAGAGGSENEGITLTPQDAGNAAEAPVSAASGESAGATQ